MKITIIKRNDHNTLTTRDDNGIYNEYFDKVMKEATFIGKLLEEIDLGEIIVSPDDNSWCGQRLQVCYNGYCFDIREDFHKHIQCYDPSQTYYTKLVPEHVQSEYTGPELPKYTFYKITTKRLLKLFDNRINKYMWMKMKSKEILKSETVKFENGLKLLKRISDAINIDVQVNNDETRHVVDTPFGCAIVCFFNDSHTTSINSVVYNMIELLDMMKK